MKQILCLVDLNGTSDSAVEYAAQLAKHSHRELALFHAVTVPVLSEAVAATPGNESHLEDLEKEAREKLAVYAGTVKEQFGVHCETIVQSDFVRQSRTLTNGIHSEDYKLIVMGTNGAETLRQFFFGIHSDQLIRDAPTPLLIVPDGYTYRNPEHVVYATDYETDDVYVIRLVQQLLAGFQPQIAVLHVSRKSTGISDVVYRSFRNELDDELEDPSVSFARVFEKEIVAGIHCYMRDNESDLLVMLAKNYSFVQKLVNRNTIQQINHIATYPLPVIHARELKK